MRDFLKVRGRAGAPCLGCGTKIRRVGGPRRACFCPTCQPTLTQALRGFSQSPGNPEADGVSECQIIHAAMDRSYLFHTEAQRAQGSDKKLGLGLHCIQPFPLSSASADSVSL